MVVIVVFLIEFVEVVFCGFDSGCEMLIRLIVF